MDSTAFCFGMEAMSDGHTSMESAGCTHRPRLVPRSEVVGTADHTQSLMAERDRAERQLQELDQRLREIRKMRFKANNQSSRPRQDADSCKENYLQEAERWQKQLEHYHDGELSVRSVLQELSQPKRLSHSKGWATALKAMAEIQRAQQDLKEQQLAASLQETQAEAADDPVAGKDDASTAGKGAGTDVNCSRSSDAAGAATAVHVSGKGSPVSGKGSPCKGSPPPKAPGKGKGKGPQGGPPPKAPPKAPPPGSGKGGAADALKKTPTRQSKLVSLNWSLKPTRSPPQAQDNAFWNETSKLVTSFGLTSGDPRRAPVAAVAKLAGVAEAGASSSAASASPSELPSQETVFDSIEVKDLPVVCLEKFFKVKEIVKKKEVDKTAKTGESPIIDQKCMQMIEVTIKKRQLHHKGESKKQAVASIKQGILQCNTEVVPWDLMAFCCHILGKHEEAGSPVSKHVRDQGEAALDRLMNPHEHRFVHELLKIPQVKQRLEAMLFMVDFPRSYETTLRKVEKVRNGLEVLRRKRPALHQCFMTAHRLGNGLNRNCKAPQAPDGFVLASIDKFLSTKTTKSPKHNALHVVIALMHPDDVQDINFSPEEMHALREARNAKIGLTHLEVTELLQNFQDVESILQENTFTRNGKKVTMETKRKSIAPSSQEARIDDPDDKFREAMENFVEGQAGHQIRQIRSSCFEMMKSYEDLAMFFCDVNSVYPPPKRDNDGKSDLVAIMVNLADQVAAISKEVQRDNLRQLLCADSDDCQ